MTERSFIGRPGRWRAIATACLIAAVGWKYIHDARLTTGFISREPPGYYGLLTDALRSGQLHLKIQPDPRLLRLANPYAGPQGIPRPHDMSFYRGKFYLYYGVTPAVILLLPWRVLAGTFLSEMAATTFFCFGGFLAGTVWLLRQRVRFFPRASYAWTLLAIAVFGFGSPVFILSAEATFYAVPISAAFFCLMVMVLLVDHAIRAAGPTRAALWLGAASLVGGLAVGARPNYILCVGWLLLPAFWLSRQRPGGAQGSWPRLRPWVAAIGPAAAVGCLLALYNYRRFGDPFDFGIKYSMSSGDLRGAALLGPQFIGKNLKLYLTKTAAFVPYFPFIFTNQRPVGVLPFYPMTALALLFPAGLISRRLRHDPCWWVTGGILLGCALSNLAVLCLFFGGEMRYLVDFAPPALLLAAAILPAAGHMGPAAATWLRRLAVGGAGAVAAWTLGCGICLALENRVPTSFTHGLENVADAAAAAAERLCGVRYGPLELRVQLPTGLSGQREPLLTTGNLDGTGDIVFIQYSDEHHVRFGFFHLGIGGPVGEPVPLDYRTPHTVTLRLGSLYPAREHPLLRHWSDEAVARMRRQLEVTLDGLPALTANVDVYPTGLGGVYVGRNPLAPDVSRPRFTGTILSERRLAVMPPPLPDPAAKGPVQIRLRFPPSLGGPAMPLVCTGRSGAGDLVSVQVQSDGRLRFIHDCWGSSDLTSDPVVADLGKIHDVEVAMGSLYPPHALAADDPLRHRLTIWLDGTLVMNTVRPFNPSSAGEVVFGYNAIGASSAVGMFTGTILATNRVPPRPIPHGPAVWGPVRLVLKFPSEMQGYDEPLVTTGETGTSDIVFVRYLEGSRLQIGLDHWGEGGPLGPPLPIDFARSHVVDIVLGSLYPPAGDPAWQAHAGRPEALRQTVQVRIDGAVALSLHRPLYPTRGGEVSIGRNDVNATSCRRQFSGQILQQERLDW